MLASIGNTAASMKCSAARAHLKTFKSSFNGWPLISLRDGTARLSYEP